MSIKIQGTTIVDDNQGLRITGVSTFTNGPVLVGSATSTGTANQRLQVTGGAYVSGSVGIGTTNPTSKLQVVGDTRVSGVVTAFDFYNDAEYPSVRPTLDLAFAQTKILDSRITFTRASTATYVNASGLIASAAVNEARFDHNPATGESLGLLVEEARTNLVTYSEQFGGAGWGRNSVTITANSATAPDGTTTADTFAGNGTNNQHYMEGSGAAGAKTISVFAKANTNNFVQLFFSGGGSSWANFNVSTGVVGSIGTLCTASIQQFANGWYRCILATTDSGAAAPTFCIVTSATSGRAESNSLSTSVYLWGAQSEASQSFPTSYIPTVASTVTRAADVASMTGTNFSSWYRQSEGTWLINFANDAAKQGAFRGVLSLGGNNTPRIQGNSVVGYGGSLSFTPTALTKAGLAYGSTEGRAVNGSVTSGAGGTIDIETYVDIGTGASSSPASYMLSTSIARLTYYPVRLPDAQLQALTAT